MKWTTELAMREAHKYQTRKDWKINSNGSYQWVHKNHPELLDQCTAHMAPPIDLCSNIYCVYAFEFSDKSVYVGLTSNEAKRKFNHLRIGPVFEKSKDVASTYRVIASDLNVKTAAALEASTLAEYRNSNWIVLNSAAPGGLGQIRVHTFESVLSDAKNYNSRTDWARNGKMYAVACNRRWIDRIAEHLNWKQHLGHCWTYESLLEDAKNYNSRGNWARNSPNAYGAAIRHGLLNTVADTLRWPEYMLSARVKWNFDSCLKEAAKFNKPSDWQIGHSASYQAARKRKWLEAIYSRLGFKAIKKQTVHKSESATFTADLIKTEDGRVAHRGHENERVLNIVAGASGSGKSWVCENLAKEGAKYVSYDNIKKSKHLTLLESADVYDPFSVSSFVRRHKNFTYRVFVIIEDPEIVLARRRARGSQSLCAKKILSDVRSSVRTYQKFGFFAGTADEVLYSMRKSLNL